MTTPADEIKAAAEKLTQLVTFLGDNRGPWYVSTPASGYPQEISNKGVPYVVAQCFEGPEIPVFAVAPYIATMHPGVGKALAAWLKSFEGLDINEHAAMSDDVTHALTIARLINQTQE